MTKEKLYALRPNTFLIICVSYRHTSIIHVLQYKHNHKIQLVFSTKHAHNDKRNEGNKNMSENNLKQRIDISISEAKELAEYWNGTLHQKVIEENLNELLRALEIKGHEIVMDKLQILENTLAQAREEIERSDNEG